jgi:hypothetical protein
MKYSQIMLVLIMIMGVFASLPAYAQDDAEPTFTLNPIEIDPASEVGFARFAHTAVDMGAIDIYRDQIETPLVENLQYGDYTDFMTLPVTSQEYVVRSSETDEELTRLHVGMSSNMSWLITASGLGDRRAFIFEPFNLIRVDIPDDEAAVRLINFVWGGPQLSVVVKGTDTPLQNMAYLDFVDQTIAPGEYDLEIVNEFGEVAGEGSMDLEAHMVYTLLIMGAEDAEIPLELLLIKSEPYSARVKFVNERGEAVDIHLRPGDERIVSNLVDGEESEFITLESTSVTFIAYAPDTGTSGQELTAGYVYLSPARDFTFVIDGDGEMNLREKSVNPITP